MPITSAVFDPPVRLKMPTASRQWMVLDMSRLGILVLAATSFGIADPTSVTAALSHEGGAK